MPEQRLAIKPADFLYLEYRCSKCKKVTSISLTPPRDDLDESLGVKARRQCISCGAGFPPDLTILIINLQEHFSKLRITPGFDLRFVVKQ
jgi:DNA-directed RNA polymerase subunit RPC12/RpoP